MKIETPYQLITTIEGSAHFIIGFKYNKGKVQFQNEANLFKQTKKIEI